MMSRTYRQRLTAVVLAGSAVLTALGLLGLTLMALLGFEEPSLAMWISSSILLFAAPVAVVAHILTTRGLTLREKRLWLRGLLSVHGGRVFRAYVRSRDGGRTSERIASLVRKQSA
jgi:hypothetical protein